ncbi:UNVERIFIED_CONTAM: hypothetical protein Slati_3711000 [Sesamum latifolium]|uniref:Uncharacterized protein n=1 Tax=Sesamum latifolium TaxID=2727402 RepID=A0AAW2U3T6_9LAMI
MVANLVNIKVEYNFSKRAYDQMSQRASNILPHNHTLPFDYYSMKKLIRDLGLPVEKINACKDDCMLYWKDDIDMDYYKFCGKVRYNPTRGDFNHKKTLYDIENEIHNQLSVIQNRGSNLEVHTSVVEGLK